MGFHGKLSKGCQLCRKRKIKCDQTKPQCLRCAKSKLPCPGYRNLHDASFVHESERVVLKARKRLQTAASHEFGRLSQRSTESSTSMSCSPSHDSTPCSLTSQETSFTLVHPHFSSLPDLGATFFFTHYIYMAPFMNDFQVWLTQCYQQCHDKATAACDPNRHDILALKTAIEAVGLAGASNVSHSEMLATLSQQHYGKALSQLKSALSDEHMAVSDETMMAVIVFGMYETVNQDSWSAFQSWTKHISAATALLDLRGTQQFQRERGGHLYIQIRSEILSSSLLTNTPVPPALIRATYAFTTGGLRQAWRDRNLASRGSICEISFRLVNLQADISRKSITDVDEIRRAALDIDADLRTWREGVGTLWKYEVLDVQPRSVDRMAAFDRLETMDAVHGEEMGEYTPSSGFRGKVHVYSSPWISAAWNNWRTLRILTNQILWRNEKIASLMDCSSDLSETLIKDAKEAIRQDSIDLCVSAASFDRNPRIFSLIKPLYIVAREALNEDDVRAAALQQLRWIEATTGIRQAGLFANVAENKVAT